MKKKIFLLFLVLIMLFSASCKEQKTKAVILVYGKCPEYLKKAVSDFNKEKGQNVVINAKYTVDKNADAVIFNINDYSKIKGEYPVKEPENLSKHLLNRRLALSDNGDITALPLYSDMAVLIYNKKTVKADRITDFESLKSAVENCDKSIRPLALSREDRDLYSICLGLGTVYLELDYNFDYEFTPFALDNAQKTALRYGENIKTFVDYFKDKTIIFDTTKESLKATISGDTALSFVKFSSLKNSKDNIAALPLFTGEGDDKKSSVFVLPDLYFTVSSKSENSPIAQDFFKYLLLNDNLAARYNLISLYEENSSNNEFKQLIRKNDIVILSPNMRSDFTKEFANIIKEYAGGSISWDETENRIKSVF